MLYTPVWVKLNKFLDCVENRHSVYGSACDPRLEVTVGTVQYYAWFESFLGPYSVSLSVKTWSLPPPPFSSSCIFGCTIQVKQYMISMAQLIDSNFFHRNVFQESWHLQWPKAVYRLWYIPIIYCRIEGCKISFLKHCQCSMEMDTSTG